MTLHQNLKQAKEQYEKFRSTINENIGRIGSHYEIVDVDGFNEPEIKGNHAYHTTLSGKTIVYHPNAYGWPTIRHCSTRYIEVGRGWLIEKGLV